MKIFALSFLFLFLSATSLGQNITVTGKLTNAENQKAVPYGHIMFQNYGMGTNSNSEGMFAFSIPDSLKTENLVISHLSFERKIISIEDLIQSKIIALDPKTENLDEISLVQPKRDKSFTYRPDWRFETVGIGNMNAALFPSTIARYYAKPEKFDKACFIASVRVYFYAIHEMVGMSPKFRIHIYEVDENGLPGEDILEEMVVEKVPGKSSLEIDLLDKKVQIPEEGFYVGLEHLFLKENEYTEVKDFYINNEMVAKDFENKRYAPVYKGIFAEADSNIKVYFYQPGGWVDIRSWDITYQDRANKFVAPVFKIKITD